MNEHSLSRLPLAALALSTLAFAVAGCADGGSYTPIQGKADFSSVVFIGDSLTAGYQSGSLLDTAQPHGYAALVANQANFRIVQPLIAPPGAPSVLELTSLDPITIVPTPGTTTGRDDITVTPTDIAVPGAVVNDVLNTAAVPDPMTGQEQITQLVLGFPALLSGHTATQYSLATQAKPTTVFVWIGNNDALNGVFATSVEGLTPLDAFTAEYTQTIGALAQTKAQLVIANIPDVTLVPYLTPQAVLQAELAAELEAGGGDPAEAPLLLEAIGIFPGDYLLLPALTDFEAAIANILAGGAPTPLPPGDVLPAATAVAIQQQVLAYNQVIAATAAQFNATLVDIHTLFDNAAANGVTADGYTATFAFLNGLFSLDGIHPTNTGYGVLANAFIDAVNQAAASKIADVNLDDIAKADPLFPVNFSTSSTAMTRLRNHTAALHMTPASIKLVSERVRATLASRVTFRAGAQHR